MRFVEKVMKFAVACGALALLARPAIATEYNLSAYFADPQKVAAAIGSNDYALRARLLGMKDHVAKKGLEQRFIDPSAWRNTIVELTSGKVVTNEFMNGFVIEMLVTALGETSEPPSIGYPFADLLDVSDYLRARGDTELAAFMRRIYNGNTGDDETGLPVALKGKFGSTGYPAMISVFTVDDAKNLLKLLPVMDKANEELFEFKIGASGPLADAAEQIVRRAVREKWTKFYQDDPTQLENGETLESAVSAHIERVLEDPYDYSDDLEFFPVKEISAWLERAIALNQATFFVYESD